MPPAPRDQDDTAPAVRVGLPANWSASSRRVAAAAAVATVLVTAPLSGVALGLPAWVALAATVLLFGVAHGERVDELLDRAGGPIAVVLVTLLIEGTGGTASAYMDIYAIALVHSAIAATWARLGLNVLLVTLATAGFGVVEGAGSPYYADLAADLAVWVTLAVLAGILARRLADVATRHRADAALVEAAALALVTTDAAGRVESWNPAAERLYGIPRAAALGHHVADLVDAPPDDPARDCSDHPTRSSYSARHHHRDGTPIDVEVTAWPVPTEDGEQTRGLLVRDVTLHRATDLRLRRQQERFRTFAEQARGVVYRYELTPEPGLAYLSPRMQDLFGLDAAAVQQDPSLVLSRIHPDDGRPFDPADGTGRFAEGVHEYRVRRADGSWLWIEDHHQPEHDDDGQLVASQGILYDVSARKQLEQARERALADAQETARQLERTALAQSVFLRSVSHQLRTPMTLVRGFAATLRRRGDELDEDTHATLLARLLDGIARLDGHLADLLDMQADDDEAGLRRHERVDLAQCCFDAVAATDTSQHRVSVATTNDHVLGDGDQLLRAVTALLRNAVEHTPPGTAIDLTMQQVDGVVSVEVTDDGPGIDPEIGDRLFEPFVQGRAAATAPSPGSGIGLSFVRQVALRHGGSITCTAAGPHGAVFTLTLPAAAAPAGERDAELDDAGRA